jgi:hypothetical protein
VADDSKKLEGLLPKGVRTFVAAGPVVASGYSWYLVRPLQADLPSGWVAAADHDGTPWIKRAAITCPETPTLAQLGNLERHVALACYGSREFRFRGILTRLFSICDGWWVTEPTWLDDCSATHSLATGIGDGDPGADGTPVIDLHLPPAVERAAHVPDMPYGFLLRASVVGHFDDPTARSCHQTADEASDAAPPVTILVVDCRAIFVVTSLVFPTDAAAVVLPKPELAFTGTEDYTDGLGNEMTRYSFDVTNRAAYAPTLFAPAPGLPPCGLTTRAPRTWVHIWDADESEAVSAFCGFTAPSDLQGVWFAVPRGELPPAAVYLTLTDRSSGLQVRSNRMPLRGP